MSIKAMMEKYNRDHQHPVNRALHNVGIPTIVFSVLIFPLNPLLATGLFVFGWILQFVGHAFEGKPPTFFSDWRYLLIGPMWVAKKAKELVGA